MGDEVIGAQTGLNTGGYKVVESYESQFVRIRHVVLEFREEKVENRDKVLIKGSSRGNVRWTL